MQYAYAENARSESTVQARAQLWLSRYTTAVADLNPFGAAVARTAGVVRTARESMISASGVSWSDAAVVLVVGVDAVVGDTGVPGVAIRPSPLTGVARVVAFCRMLRAFSFSVPDFGVDRTN